MLNARPGKKISPEVRKLQKPSVNKAQLEVEAASRSDVPSLGDRIAEMKRQWKATTQMKLPALRVAKPPNEQQQ